MNRKIKIISKKQIKKIEKKYKLSKETKNFFELVRYFSYFQDSRKANIQKLMFCIDQLLKQVRYRTKVPRKELNQYFINEIIDLLKNNKKLSKKQLMQREDIITYAYFENNKIKNKLFLNKEAREIKNYFVKYKQSSTEKNQLSGFVASRSKSKNLIKGKVRIVLNPDKSNFKKGEILVAGMTRPEYVPLMKKAKAIITNEGGITTHAAIVSRELGVPCIIGTKIAVETLKTGDLVEMDLNKGIIEKL